MDNNDIGYRNYNRLLDSQSLFASENQGILLWSYYFFQILGGIGTCMAVVVALFKDSIKSLYGIQNLILNC